SGRSCSTAGSTPTPAAPAATWASRSTSRCGSCEGERAEDRRQKTRAAAPRARCGATIVSDVSGFALSLRLRVFAISGDASLAELVVVLVEVAVGARAAEELVEVEVAEQVVVPLLAEHL